MKGVKIILLCLWSASLFSQADSTFKLSDYVEFSGYVKEMQIISFARDLNDLTNDNLLHNRLKFRIFPYKNFTVGVEFRNRIFFGETVDTTPNYGEFISIDNGFFDFSWLVADKSSLVFLSQMDRAWVDWSNDDWEIRAGRQRINWGTNLFWNPNDLFNAYSLVDFDYEERPGTDALRIQRHFENMSSLDFAIQPARDSSEWVAALMYKFNKRQYDFQFLGGWWYDDIVIGTGWAGNLKEAGFKGELSFFIPREEGETVISASISVDYIFKNQLFLTGGFLFNSNGINNTFTDEQNLFIAPLSAKNLLPMKYSGLVSVSYPFNPILSGGVTAIYSPGVHTAFLMPSINYSIAENWEIALFGQSFWMKTNRFKSIVNGVYLRLKVSF